MVVFRRKRIVLVLCFLVLSFSVYFATTNNKLTNVSNRNYDVTQVSSIPATRKGYCY